MGVEADTKRECGRAAAVGAGADDQPRACAQGQLGQHPQERRAGALGGGRRERLGRGCRRVRRVLLCTDKTMDNTRESIRILAAKDALASGCHHRFLLLCATSA